MIYKKLKDYEFKFDEETKTLTIVEHSDFDDDELVALDKIRMFSLARFIIRISQKMSSRKRK